MSSDFLSVIHPGERKDRDLGGSKQSYPILPVRDTVLFPHAVLPLTVGRESSIQLVQSLGEEKTIVVVAQREARVDTPEPSDLFSIGTLATVHKVVKMPNQSLFVFTEGTERVKLTDFDQSTPYMKSEVEVIEDIEPEKSPEAEALQRNILAQFQHIVTASPTLSDELQTIALNIDEPGRLVDFIASSLPILTTIDKQELLETPDVMARMTRMNRHLAKELEVQQLRNKIQSEVQDQVQQSQRDYYLREQLKAIQKELGEMDEGQKDIEDLREKLEAAGMPEGVKKDALKELTRLSRMSPMAADYSVTRNYIEWLAVLPWAKTSGGEVDIVKAKEILDTDHYDLKKVKDRILDYLSVRRLKPSMKGPILCFVGPPGVGKTSLGKSIARALGRKFQRMSLGGLHDEAELRGHRRTYIGAMPGRLLQAMRRAGFANPVLMLDEVDKLGRDFRGDPAAALLEILDPEQNKTFRDNYLDLPFDLSKVMFVTTANTLDTIPAPLLDRMEILRLSGYSEEEKAQIARRYLLPRQLAHAGLSQEQCNITEEALRKIIASYTREAGVRRLEQTLGRVIRKVALKFAENVTESVTVKAEDVSEMLGPEPITPEMARRELPAGVATGLAWTETGGDVLYIEATLLPNGKDLTITGQLGEVMQESAKTARSFVWAHAAEFGIKPELFLNSGLHIHAPRRFEARHRAQGQPEGSARFARGSPQRNGVH